MDINYSQILISALKPLWPFYLLLCIVAIIKLIYLVFQHTQLGKAGMYEIDKMSGDDFERYLAILFEKLGYSVQIVGSHIGDYGTDLIIEKAGIKTAVQAKRWNYVVGVKSVQEVYGSLHMYNCTEAMVVTNNYFSHQAQALARANKVELWDRNHLAKVILASKA